MSIAGKIRTVLTLGKGVTGNLPEPDDKADPFDQFADWLQFAETSGVFLPEALTLSTCDIHNRPSSRMVLLKSFDQNGFVFFSNYQSRKAQDIEANPNVCMLFHWSTLQRQVRIEGCAKKITTAQSEAYFKSRGRGSKIGAWASKQSQPIASRDQLKKREQYFQDKFPTDVPLPDFWGGYKLEPTVFEFWQGRANRLHDRISYTKDGQTWKSQRISP